MNAGQYVKAAQLPLFPGLTVDGETAAPVAWREKAAEALATARACAGKLKAIDLAAAALLKEAPRVPLRGRLALELARRDAETKGVPVRILNALAQIAQRRWKAAGLPVSFSRRSPLDLIGDDAWLALPLADELAALAAQPSRHNGRA